jgi:flavin reductase (DIM6/NTAB) family NADH-FMN oxidoreductase RutF
LTKKKVLEGLFEIDPSLSYRLFYPQVPMIVCSKKGRDVAGMTANSLIPVSDKPPLIALAVKAESRTSKIITKSGRFSINWVNYREAGFRSIVLKLAKPFNEREGHDKLKASGVPFKVTKRVPVLASAIAYAICDVKSRHKTGDHDLFIGRVVDASASKDFADEKYWRFREYKPILYLGSNKKEPLTTIS